MRSVILAVPVSLLLLASQAGAQSTSYPSTSYPITDTESISTVQVTAPPKAVNLSEDQTRAVSGTYAMSNGWHLHIRPAHNGVYARIDDQKPIRLIGTSPDNYVSRDGNVAMEFNRGDDRDEMVMSYVPDPRVAQVIVVRSTMASR